MAKTFNIQTLVGKSEKEAIRIAKKNGFQVVLPGMVVIAIFDPNRVHFTVKNGKVTHVRIG